MAIAEAKIDQKIEFLKDVATRVSAGEVDLPSFPDVVIQIKQALENDETSSAHLVKIISTEPVLAARLLTIANSSALRPGGEPISNLNEAVIRLGRQAIQSTAMSYAMSQLKSTPDFDDIAVHMDELWQRSTHVAALCYVLAGRFTKLNPDEALLVGLMHVIGEMYIVIRANEHPTLSVDDPGLHRLQRGWGCRIGASILKQWDMSERITEAIENHQQPDTADPSQTAATHTDVLRLGVVLREILSSKDQAEFHMEEMPSWERLGTQTSDILDVMRKSQEQLRLLRSAISQ
ncbi:MAG: HDOD domain-containing protein [Pseudomonadota bacterium]